MKTIQLAPGVDTGLATLTDSRALVQANSGGGKSWCLRRLLEQSHGAIQQLVLDPEGEFQSLREHFDYVLAAKHGGDTAADPRAAGAPGSAPARAGRLGHHRPVRAEGARAHSVRPAVPRGARRCAEGPLAPGARRPG